MGKLENDIDSGGGEMWKALKVYGGQWKIVR